MSGGFKFTPRDRSGFRGFNWNDPLLQAVLADANLSVEVQLWQRPVDYLEAPNWWQWREPCDCPDTSFGRNPHRWNCAQTPIWAQTIRDLDVNPWTVVVNSRAYCDLSFPPVGINAWDGLPGTHCGRGPCCLGDGHSGRCAT